MHQRPERSASSLGATAVATAFRRVVAYLRAENEKAYRLRRMPYNPTPRQRVSAALISSIGSAAGLTAIASLLSHEHNLQILLPIGGVTALFMFVVALTEPWWTAALKWVFH